MVSSDRLRAGGQARGADTAHGIGFSGSATAAAFKQYFKSSDTLSVAVRRSVALH